jgi:hypothetical protein
MFTVGTRVKVIKKDQCAPYAYVGNKGTITCDKGFYDSIHCYEVFFEKYPQIVDADCLKRLHEKKVVTPLRD